MHQFRQAAQSQAVSNARVHTSEECYMLKAGWSSLKLSCHCRVPHSKVCCVADLAICGSHLLTGPIPRCSSIRCKDLCTLSTALNTLSMLRSTSSCSGWFGLLQAWETQHDVHWHRRCTRCTYGIPLPLLPPCSAVRPAWCCGATP